MCGVYASILWPSNKRVGRSGEKLAGWLAGWLVGWSVAEGGWIGGHPGQPDDVEEEHPSSSSADDDSTLWYGDSITSNSIDCFPSILLIHSLFVSSSSWNQPGKVM